MPSYTPVQKTGSTSKDTLLARQYSCQRIGTILIAVCSFLRSNRFAHAHTPKKPSPKAEMIAR